MRTARSLLDQCRCKTVQRQANASTLMHWNAHQCVLSTAEQKAQELLMVIVGGTDFSGAALRSLIEQVLL